jgi:hypothetical protein
MRLLLLSILLFAVLPLRAIDVPGVPADPTDPSTGLWGGKWDDTWEVYLRVHPREPGQSGTRKIEYIWREDFGRPLRHNTSTAREQVAGYLHTGDLYFRLDYATGLLWGNFKTPRMANLVRMNPSLSDLETADPAGYGWKEGKIPALKASEIILGSDSKLLGAPGLPNAPGYGNKLARLTRNAHLLTDAIKLWSTEHRKAPDSPVTLDDIRPYIWPGHTIITNDFKDAYGHRWTLRTVQEGPYIDPKSLQRLREDDPAQTTPPILKPAP